MAEQLQAIEQRRMEVLQQTALALNHELNTAASIIELQLQLLDRRSGGDERLEKPMRQIHESLERMTRFVQALKQIRRIVLTDYVSGVKMLDVEKSLAEDERPATSETSTAPNP
jgi:signal transduction histidine kinase